MFQCLSIYCQLVEAIAILRWTGYSWYNYKQLSSQPRQGKTAKTIFQERITTVKGGEAVFPEQFSQKRLAHQFKNGIWTNRDTSHKVQQLEIIYLLLV